VWRGPLHRLRRRRRGEPRTPKFPFTGSRIIKFVFDVAKEVYIDVELELAATLARD
jgi:hypothetical protein